MNFTWDNDKNESNLKKHGIDFETASQVFSLDNYVVEYDADHSTLDEDRFLAKGVLDEVGAVVVVFVEVVEDEIRIISARIER